MNKVKNAKITGTRLGVPCSDHGMLSFLINLDYGDSVQSFGGWELDNYDKQTQRRVATTAGSSLLLAVNKIFGVDWEDLKDLPCQAYSSNIKVHAIGNYIKDLWLGFDKQKWEFVVTKFDELRIDE